MADSPIFEQLAARMGVRVDVDAASALASLDRSHHELDAQSIAYRGMGPGDVVLDGELAGMAERAHPPYVPGTAPPPATVEEYEAAGWDRDRLDPRDRHS